MTHIRRNPRHDGWKVGIRDQHGPFLETSLRLFTEWLCPTPGLFPEPVRALSDHATAQTPCP
jgi:hypothetical protein